MGTTRLLVKILNICLQFYNLHQGPSWLSLLVFIGYYNCQSNLVVKKLGKFLVTSDFSTEVLLNVRKKEEKQNKKCSHQKLLEIQSTLDKECLAGYWIPLGCTLSVTGFWCRAQISVLVQNIFNIVLTSK